MDIDPQRFKELMAHWASGVTIATSRYEQAPLGMTVSSFTSVSLHPPQILICVNQQAHTHGAIISSGYFAVNLLGEDQREWGIRFAGLQPDISDRFAGIEWFTAESGAPILTGVMAWLDCQVRHALASGDHTIFVGEVIDSGLCAGGEPLIYYRRHWRHLAPASANIQEC